MTIVIAHPGLAGIISLARRPALASWPLIEHARAAQTSEFELSGSTPLYAARPSIYHPQGHHAKDFRPLNNDWKDYHRYTTEQLPRNILPWLLDSGSLTQRLIKASDNQFKVQVLSHHWQRPRADERALLQMHTRELAIVREVALLCANQPWVFARSIIPASSLTGKLRRLRKFKNHSLGAMLFSDQTMRRYPFQIASIHGLSPQMPSHLQQDVSLWGRRCRFELSNKPILVSEIFLPSFRP